MRLFAQVHLYPPDHCAGAEMMLHTLLREMVWRGHEATVSVRKSSIDQYQGVKIIRGSAGIKQAWKMCDVGLTHLDMTRQAMSFSGAQHKPLVHIVHNDKQLEFHRVTKAELVIFNSRWISEKVRWAGKSMVIHPPVDPSDYRTTPGDKITLVNLMAAKGGEILWELARAMPERDFLAVKGAYGHQIIEQLPNVEVVANDPDMRSIYSKTRILLMPSSYESFGRVAIEAGFSGIPTLASPTPGLREALPGIFVDRDWERAIRILDDPRHYAFAGRRARRRSEQLWRQSEDDFDRFEQALKDLV